MGARTLEAGLRLRLLSWLGPLLLVVGAALLFTTYRGFAALQSQTAGHRAQAALRMLDAERAEGDDLDTAMREVAQTADADGVPIVLRSDVPPLERSGLQPMPPSLRDLAPEACASASSDDGAPWLACAERRGTVTVVVGQPMAQMQQQLRRLTIAWGVLILLALAGAGLAVRRLHEAIERERAQSAHIAHELRTPLTGLRAELEELVRGGDPAAARALSDADRLRDVVDAILVLAGPRDARAPTTTVNVADLARELAPPGAVVDAPDEALVSGDARLLTLALRNLVDNAERHGRGARSVRVTREGGGVRVAVVDAGPGVAAEQRQRVFERYWRGTADGDGSGLGLALVRAVAERHGGRAEVAPAEPSGLVASVVLPKLVDWSDPARRAP